MEELAQTDIPVLLTGESGTGKSVYARLIHQLSRHRNWGMEKLNCTMLAPGKLLSQLKGCLAKAEEGHATVGWR